MFVYICIYIKSQTADIWECKFPFILSSTIACDGRFYCLIADISHFSPSEFLAEDSQEKFWSFVEASQNIGSSDHHGKIEANIYLTLWSGKMLEKNGLLCIVYVT